jgi:Predicted unusual protein kinase
VAESLAGGVALGAAREAVAGRRPRLADLLLTPANAARFARELSHLRGAAMKMGQLLSMDAGEMLPPEIAEAFAHLRADAQHMPPKQLRAALDRRWGRGWLDRFERFDPRPMAAASIGQVHRATTKDGRDLAIKIQYPGVRESIDSDVANMATLIRMAGAPPEGLDMGPLLDEARRQLRDEADYAREGAYLDRYGALLADDPEFVVPRRHADFTTEDVLAMDSR